MMIEIRPLLRSMNWSHMLAFVNGPPFPLFLFVVAVVVVPTQKKRE